MVHGFKNLLLPELLES